VQQRKGGVKKKHRRGEEEKKEKKGEDRESLNTKEKRKRTGRVSIERKQREREGTSSPVYPTLSKKSSSNLRVF
jgi:hypothetical protein